MKIGTLLTAAIVSLSAVGGGLAVYVAVSKYQTMDRVSVAQSRLEVVRAVGEIPRYMNPERGFATNILYGPAVVDPKTRAELNEKYRKQTDGARDKMNAIRKNLSAARRRRGRRQRDRRAELEIRSPSRRHRQGDRRSGRVPQGSGQEDRRRQRRLQCRRHRAARRTGPQMAQLDGDAYRQAVYANIAWTLRDVGGYNASLHKNLVGYNRVADRSRKDGPEPLAGPHRPDPDVAAGIARQSGDARQHRRGAGPDERSLCQALRPGTEARQGRRNLSGKFEHDADTFFVESQNGLGAVIDVRDAFYDNAEQILGSAGSSARLSFLIALAGSSRSRLRASPRDHGPPPRLPADRRTHRDDVATCQRRRVR